MVCKKCSKRVCNCPLVEKQGCIVPCIDSKVTIDYGNLQGTNVNVDSTMLTDVRLLVYSPSGVGVSKLLWHKSFTSDPTLIDMATDKYSVTALFEGADTATWTASNAYRYELYITFNDGTEVLQKTGYICVQAVAGQNLSDATVDLEYDAFGRTILLTFNNLSANNDGYIVDDVTIDWGDGTAPQTTTETQISHYYEGDGEYEICVTLNASVDINVAQNPCLESFNSDICFSVEMCADNINKFKEAANRYCEFLYTDKFSFINDEMQTGNDPAVPFYYRVSFTFDGVVYAQDTVLEINSISDLEMQVVNGNPVPYVIINYLNSLPTNVQFSIVDNAGVATLRMEYPSAASTWEFKLFKSYAPAFNYSWTDAAYTGDTWVGSPAEPTCGTIV